jgi:hypothetical protein
MTPGDWAAVAVGIAALVVALAALPANNPHRRAVLAVSGVLVLIAVGIGLHDNFFKGRAEAPNAAGKPSVTDTLDSPTATATASPGAPPD